MPEPQSVGELIAAKALELIPVRYQHDHTLRMVVEAVAHATGEVIQAREHQMLNAVHTLINRPTPTPK